MSKSEDRRTEIQREATVRNNASPLWLTFRNGMSSIDLAAATGGRVSRITAARFLESAVDRGAAVRKMEKGRGRGIVRYWRTGEAPSAPSVEMEPMRPLREAFPGRRIIPVREGGVVLPVNYSGSHYEAVGDRGARS